MILTENSNISNLKYEFNSLCKNVYNIQSLINSKKSFIKSKNDAIDILIN